MTNADLHIHIHIHNYYPFVYVFSYWMAGLERPTGIAPSPLRLVRDWRGQGLLALDTFKCDSVHCQRQARRLSYDLRFNRSDIKGLLLPSERTHAEKPPFTQTNPLMTAADNAVVVRENLITQTNPSAAAGRVA